MTDAVLPPKKSKAARSMDKAIENGDANAENAGDKDSDDDFVEVNVFTQNIVLEGKRERKAPKGSLKLKEWMAANLEEKEDVNYKMGDLYEAYLEGCVSDGTPGVPLNEFMKDLKKEFAKGFAIKESSPYNGVIKARKARKPKGDKPKAASLKLKMKDIISRILQELGNPMKGIRFPTLKMHISAKYPALRIDVRPGILKNSLMRLSYYGHLELVKGVGAAGFYRLPGPELNPDGTAKDPEEEKVKKEKKPKTKGEVPEDKEGGGDGDAAKDGEDGEKKETNEEERNRGSGNATSFHSLNFIKYNILPVDFSKYCTSEQLIDSL